MAMVKQEIVHRGWPRYGKQQQYSSQLARPSQDVVNPSLDKLEKEVVVPKEFEHLRRRTQLQAYRAAATCKHGNSGFFILLRWLIGFFLPPNSKGFFLLILLSPYIRSSLRRPRQDPYQTLIKDLLLILLLKIKYQLPLELLGFL